MFLSEYTGGSAGWGTMITRCQFCGEVVAEYETDENGVPTTPIFDEADTHACPEDEE